MFPDWFFEGLQRGKGCNHGVLPWGGACVRGTGRAGKRKDCLGRLLVKKDKILIKEDFNCEKVSWENWST